MGHSDLSNNQESAWYAENSGDTVIVFIHGIHSDNKKAWAFSHWWKWKAIFWPDLVLADPTFQDNDGQSLSIYLASYYSSVDAGDFGIERCAESVFRDLQRHNVLEKSNIVFVGHSMGGIIARRILGQHWVEFKPKKVGVVLMASPSGGSIYAKWFKYLTYIYGHAQAKQLKSDDELLRAIHGSFEPLAEGHHLTGAEAYEHYFYFHHKIIPGMRNVVPVDSAERYFKPATFLPKTTHSTCVRPRNQEDRIHRVLQDFWTRYRNFVPSHQIEDGEGHLESNPFFTGRERLFRRIGKKLIEANAVLLHGMGGVGKTSLALEYARQNRAQYDQLFVLPCESETVMFAHLAHWAGATPEATATPKEVEQAAKKGVEYIAQGGKNLIVLDNADDQLDSPFVKAMLAKLSSHHVIVTSRPDNHLGGVPSIAVKPLPSRMGGLLFYRRWKKRPNAEWTDVSQADAALCREISIELEGLPLALEQAGTMATAIDPRQLLTEYRTVGDARRELFQKMPENHHQQSLWKTVEVALRRLSVPAQTLVQLCAFMDADAIDLRLFDEWKMSLPSELQQTQQLGQWREVRREALNSVLIGMVSETDAYSASGMVRARLTMHRAFQTVVREIIGAREDNVEAANMLLAEWWYVGASNAAYAMFTYGRYREGLPQSDLAYRQRLELLGDDHLGITRDLNNLASLLKATNRLSEAEPLMRRALEIDERSFGKEHPKVAIRLNNLASLLQDTNRLSEAEPLMRRTLEIDEKSFGKDHPEVATDLNNLASLLKTTNRLSEAEPLMRRALEIDEKSFGKEHPNVAIRLNNLALLLQNTNRLSEAEPLMRRVIELFENSLGKDHPNVATSLNNLASLLQDTNRLSEAEPLMRRALEIDEKSFGKEHPNVATDLNNLALLLQTTNRLSEAEPLMRRALEIDEKSFGKEHPNVAIRLNNLASLLQATNRLSEAEPLMRRALEIDEKSLGNDHPNVAIRLNNLALLLLATNRLAEAEPFARRGLIILAKFQRAASHEHPHMETGIRNYIALLGDLGRSDDEIRAELDSIAREASQ